VRTGIVDARNSRARASSATRGVDHTSSDTLLILVSRPVKAFAHISVSPS